MIPIRDVLRQETRLYGTVNQHPFEFVGGGDGRPFDGIVNTEIKSTSGPLHFPAPLLSPVLIMGYPTFSTYHPGAFDLFKISDGYEYDRFFSFENGGSMKSHHRVDYYGDHLSGDFHVSEGSVEVPDIVSCDPTIETFVPAGPGKIRSQFTMAWHVRGGGLFKGTVSSEYRLTHNAGLPYLQFRYIVFEGEYTSERIRQTERLNVFRDIRKLWFPSEQHG